MDIEMITSIDEDKRAVAYAKKLEELRRDGDTRVTEMSERISALKRDKTLSRAEKAESIQQCKKELEKAREIAKRDRSKILELQKEAVKYVTETSQKIEQQVKEHELRNIAEGKAELRARIAEIQEKGELRIEKLQGEMSVDEMKLEVATIRYETKSAIFDAKNRYKTLSDTSKAAIVQAYVDRVQMNRGLRNGKSDFKETQKLKWLQYKQNFTTSQFLMNNGLFLAIVIFFIVCIILAPSMTGGSHLLTLPNVFTILEQASTRTFYALGVAGLILITGTDLSIGRMVGMGAIITGLILHPGVNIVKFFGLGPWDFTHMAMGARVFMALSCSIIACVLFSMFAGWFTARLKMHPFISTLGNMLIIYGLMFYGTTGTPVGSIDNGIKQLIGGRWILGVVNGELVTLPKLILPAILAIVVAWFIWNKTTFGKNMYAVGDNPEAAAVSGISVFWTTMFIFIMAGIFYGCGSFLEAFRANASAGTGQGYELDAISACVVGGISFNGGVGKISGAVIGVIIFTGLTYCLTFLGIDTNLQFVFKGLILLAAVALDSFKYLKRK